MNVLIAVAASPVVTNNSSVALTYLWDGEAADDESTQTEIWYAVSLYGSRIDGRCVVRSVSKEIPLSVACDGAELAHAFAAGKKDWCLLNVLNTQPCWQVAVLVVHLSFGAGEADSG